MPEEKTDNNTRPDSGFFITANGLRGKQSVRATFKLPEHIIKLLGGVATQLGLKQKSLFDQLVEDKDVLNRVVNNANKLVVTKEERRPKTFVLSRRSLDVLEFVARQQNIPRDLLVEISIQRLLPVLNDEQKKHASRKLICQEMENLLIQGQALLAQTGQLLGEDDKTFPLIEEVVQLCRGNTMALKAIIARGQSIDKFCEDQNNQSK